MRVCVRIIHFLAGRAKQSTWTSASGSCANRVRVHCFSDSSTSCRASSGNHVRSAADLGSLGSVGRRSRLHDDAQLEEALEAMDTMEKQGIQVTPNVVKSVLQGCLKKKDLAAGRRVQAVILRTGLHEDAYLGSVLIRLFSACGSLVEADDVFEKVKGPNLQMWQAIISAHASHGRVAQAIKLYNRMKQDGVRPNHQIFVALLKACSSAGAVTEGRKIHGDVVESGFEWHLYVGSTLIDMYGKAGCMHDARVVFDRLPKADIVVWNTLIQGYSRNELGQEAIDLFKQMLQEGVVPNNVTFLSVLRACGSLAALDEGRLVHGLLTQSGLASDLCVANTLLDMYAKCDSLIDALALFESLPERDVVSWNVLIRGYAHNMHVPEALQLYTQMQEEGKEPDLITFVSILRACATVAALDHGKLIHVKLMEEGRDAGLIVGNTLMHMYVRCSSLEAAQEVFGKMSQRDVLSWKAIIGGCVQNGRDQEALELFQEMQRDGVKPDKAIFASVLKACASLAALDQGKQIHSQVVKSKLELDPIIGNTLVDMYAKCNRLDDARNVFDMLPEKTVVSWSAMFGAYASHGQGHMAISLFKQMQQAGVQPNGITFINMLKACGSMAELHEGKQIHAQIEKSGLEEFVGNSLLDMYLRCGSVVEARKVFDRLTRRDIGSWTVMIGGYADSGFGSDAIQLYRQMRAEGMEPSKVTFLSILRACGSIPALHQGILVHEELIQNGLDADVAIANTLIDMYANCGSLDHALDVFEKLPEKTAVSWTAMIGAYAQHGHGQRALQLFNRMQEDGMKPDDVTLLCVLAACSHAGLVDEGFALFRRMHSDFGVSPGMKQYASMVDLLCRAGHLSEAEALIDEMPMKPKANVWMALLGGCQNHDNLELGKRCFDSVVELEPENAAAYVLMGNLYAAAGRWEDKADTLGKMVSAGVHKDPGCTWIQVNNQVHSFLATDSEHPERRLIYDTLESLSHDIVST